AFGLVKVSPPLERVSDGTVHVDIGRLKRWKLCWLDADVPEVRHRRIEHERAERVFGRGNLCLCHDDRLLARSNFGFRFDDVDWRSGADLDSRSRVAERLLREL